MNSNKYLLLALALFISSSIRLSAQNNRSGDDFANFRKELQGEYDDFRKEINDEYVYFLSQAWQKFRLFQGKKPDETPKPLTHVPYQEEKNSIETVVGTDGVTDTLWEATDSLQLDYFGAKLRLRYQSRTFLLPAITEQSVGLVWKEMAGSRFSILLHDMLRCKEQMQMNDWAYFQLVKQVADQLSDLQSEDSRTVFQHFLLVQSGYDVRLARIDRFLVLLVPITEEVYARSYLEMNGRTYYVISNQDFKSYQNVYTYQLPDKLIQNPSLSLMMSRQLLLPMQPNPFSIKAAGMEVSGEVNQNKIRFYKEYPLCELAVYARAVPDDKLMEQLQASLARQLAGKTFVEALNQLLLWVQKGFGYQTDDEQFGHEKPFFMEETFYYPACDCEDRSILFAYLVNRLLGRDVLLLDYPGHVATAVCADEEEDMKGTHVRLEGKKYLVCDPTYVNAKVGQLMPSCKAKRPKVIKL